MIDAQTVITRESILNQYGSLNEGRKDDSFKTLIESGQFFEAAVIASSFKGGSSIKLSGRIADLCCNLNEGQKRDVASPLIKEGFYNAAAEIAPSDDTYAEISIDAAGKNDIFLVTQFAGSIQDPSKKNETLERCAKIIAEKGPSWICLSDLKGIAGKDLLAQCKELIANRRV